MASTQKKGKSFALSQFQINYLLVLFSVSMPPTDRHTMLLDYIQCKYIQISPEHSSPSCELCSSPAPRKEVLGQTRALSKSGGSSEHEAGSKQVQNLRSLCLFQDSSGIRESWRQQQQPGPVQWGPSKDTSAQTQQKDTATAQVNPLETPAVAAASTSEEEGLPQNQARPLLPSFTAQNRNFTVSVLRYRGTCTPLPLFPSTVRGWITRFCNPVFQSWGEEGQGS